MTAIERDTREKRMNAEQIYYYYYYFDCAKYAGLFNKIEITI